MVVPSKKQSATGQRLRRILRSSVASTRCVVGLLVFAAFLWHPIPGTYEEDLMLLSSSLLAITVAKIDSSSVRVVHEKDVARDYANVTEFEATFFISSPPCTPLAASQVSFTLVTQASMDRLWIMKHHCERWPSPLPISIAVYLPDGSSYDETHVAHELGVKLACDLTRMQVTVLKGNAPLDRYPVNILRNLAMRAATTSHVMYTDADFLISQGLHDDLLEMAPLLANDSMAAIVVPAFTYVTACPDKFSSENIQSQSCLAQEWDKNVPKTKNDLLRLLATRRSSKPNIKPGFHGVHFHGSTQYAAYESQTKPLLIPCISSYLYEPYLAVRLCQDLPEFPEVFRGYGWNKNVWILWLTRKLPYKLWQTPKGFVLHLPHQESASRNKLKNAPGIGGDAESSVSDAGNNTSPTDHERYKNWFKRMVPLHPNRVPSCPGTKK